MYRLNILEEEKLKELKGGTNITGPIINAFVNIFNVIKDAGYSLGSGIRRISENNLCPLK